MQAQSGSSSFTAGNQSATTPTANPAILWGAAASAMLGASLAEWQRKREEESARLAASRGGGGGGGEEEGPDDALAKRRAKVIAKNEAKRAQERRWEQARRANITQQAKSAIAKNKNLTAAETEMGKVNPVTPYVPADYVDKDEEKRLAGNENQRAWKAVLIELQKRLWKKATATATPFFRTPTSSPTSNASQTPTPDLRTPALTWTPSNTPIPSDTPTLPNTPTVSATPTASITPTASGTPTPHFQTPSSTSTPSNDEIPTYMPTPLNSGTQIPTASPLPPPTPMNPNDQTIFEWIIEGLTEDYTPGTYHYPAEPNLPTGGGGMPGGLSDTNVVD